MRCRSVFYRPSLTVSVGCLKLCVLRLARNRQRFMVRGHTEMSARGRTSRDTFAVAHIGFTYCVSHDVIVWIYCAIYCPTFGRTRYTKFKRFMVGPYYWPVFIFISRSTEKTHIARNKDCFIYFRAKTFPADRANCSRSTPLYKGARAGALRLSPWWTVRIQY